MDCAHDPDEASLSAGTPDQGTWARLGHRVDPGNDGSISACVRIGAPGLVATVHDLEAGEQLSRLAADARQFLG